VSTGSVELRQASSLGEDGACDRGRGIDVVDVLAIDAALPTDPRLRELLFASRSATCRRGSSLAARSPPRRRSRRPRRAGRAPSGGRDRRQDSRGATWSWWDGRAARGAAKLGVDRVFHVSLTHDAGSQAPSSSPSEPRRPATDR
jgi:hypothetical protein